jgi:hypothetical protein
MCGKSREWTQRRKKCTREILPNVAWHKRTARVPSLRSESLRRRFYLPVAVQIFGVIRVSYSVSWIC